MAPDDDDEGEDCITGCTVRMSKCQYSRIARNPIVVTPAKVLMLSTPSLSCPVRLSDQSRHFSAPVSDALIKTRLLVIKIFTAVRQKTRHRQSALNQYASG